MEEQALGETRRGMAILEAGLPHLPTIHALTRQDQLQAHGLLSRDESRQVLLVPLRKEK